MVAKPSYYFKLENINICIPVRNLPFLVWCFYDCHKTPALEITIFVQLLGQSIIMMVFLATDTLFPCFAYIGVGQFKVLGLVKF